MTSELKPCAHCGSDPRLYGDDSATWTLCRVSCPSCFTSGGSYKTCDGAVTAWNRRAPSEAVGLLREVVEEYEAATSSDDFGMTFNVDKIRRFLAAQEGT